MKSEKKYTTEVSLKNFFSDVQAIHNNILNAYFETRALKSQWQFPGPSPKSYYLCPMAINENK